MSIPSIDLKKIEQFTKIAESEISSLTTKVAEYEETIESLRTKLAAADSKEKALHKAIEKAAKQLYDADFITDDDGSDFTKKAKENPVYLAEMIGSLCSASKVANMGKMSSVTLRTIEQNDPVALRAFGRSNLDRSVVEVDE